MNIAVFSSRNYDEAYFSAGNYDDFNFTFHKTRLSIDTVSLAEGFDAVCVFTNDKLDEPVINALHNYGVKAIALRCAGFNNVDVKVANALNIPVVRVPEYAPEAIAEHAIALLQTLNRKLHKAYSRVRDGNFLLQGLMGYNLHGKTVGVVGTGNIGLAFCRIMNGFGCNVLASDPVQSEQAKAIGVQYTDFENLVAESDIISLHCPLIPATHHLIDNDILEQAKPGFTLINTSRGGLVDTKAAINHLKNGKIGAFALDVYEHESGLFFEDHSETIIQDDVFQRLMSFSNVLITGHQAFFTHEAMTEIVYTTLNNLKLVLKGESSGNECWM